MVILLDLYYQYSKLGKLKPWITLNYPRLDSLKNKNFEKNKFLDTQNNYFRVTNNKQVKYNHKK